MLFRITNMANLPVINKFYRQKRKKNVLFKLLVIFGLPLLVIKLFVVDGCLLVLLVFADEIVHVGLGFSELHLVHTLSSVPMQESFPSEHSGELLGDPLEELLNSGGVTNEGGSHLQPPWWNVTDCGLDIIWNPLNEV